MIWGSVQQQPTYNNQLFPPCWEVIDINLVSRGYGNPQSQLNTGVLLERSHQVRIYRPTISSLSILDRTHPSATLDLKAVWENLRWRDFHCNGFKSLYLSTIVSSNIYGGLLFKESLWGFSKSLGSDSSK